MATTADGPRILVESDDGVHPENLYAECAFAELDIPTAGDSITMAATPAAQDLGNTALGTGNAAASVTAVAVTVDAAAGTFTIDRPGVYEVYYNGRVTGEEDEDVTLAFVNNGSAFSPAVKDVIQLDAATGVFELEQQVSRSRLVSLAIDDVVKLTVLGSASEVITFKDFTWGLRLVKSSTFEDPR